MSSLRGILRWTQRVLFASAISMLAYCGFVLVDGWRLVAGSLVESFRQAGGSG